MHVVRADFDRLKATLTNCVRLGPESRNREAHFRPDPVAVGHGFRVKLL
jgi:hypothetical protein